MEQLRKLLECDECDGMAVITPLTEADVKYCPFCGSEFKQPEDE